LDEPTALVHSVATTADNAGEVTQIGDLLHGKQRTIFGAVRYGRGEHYQIKAELFCVIFSPFCTSALGDDLLLGYIQLR
jgi:hypothetical protein